MLQRRGCNPSAAARSGARMQLQEAHLAQAIRVHRLNALHLVRHGNRPEGNFRREQAHENDSAFGNGMVKQELLVAARGPMQIGFLDKKGVVQAPA